MNVKDSQQTADLQETALTLGLLNAVEQDSNVTQRAVATELGVALGLANAYLKRCVKKGFIKVQQIPAKRYAYYLTPQGFAEKSRLTTFYLTQSLSFFRAAKDQCLALLAECDKSGRRRILIAGSGDLCEIADLCAREFALDVVAIIDPDSERQVMLGHQVVSCLAEAPAFDVILVADMTAPQQMFERLRADIADDRILTPPLLHVTRSQPVLAE